MRLGPRLGLFMESLQVGLELCPIYAPDPSSAKLDGGKVPGPYESVNLGHADVQVRRNVLEGQEPGLDPSTFSRALRAHVSDDSTVSSQILVSEPVWFRLGC